MASQGGGDREGCVSVAQIPTNFNHGLRACRRCRLVKTYDQFRASGCENCAFFQMEDDHDRVVDCTTPNFTGVILVMDPSRTWVPAGSALEDLFQVAILLRSLKNSLMACRICVRRKVCRMFHQSAFDWQVECFSPADHPPYQ